MPDETRQATAAVARILTRAGPDPAVTANEIIQALRTHGWRHVIQPPPPRPPPVREERLHAIAAGVRREITKEAPDG